MDSLNTQKVVSNNTELDLLQSKLSEEPQVELFQASILGRLKSLGKSLFQVPDVSAPTGEVILNWASFYKAIDTNNFAIAEKLLREATPEEACAWVNSKDIDHSTYPMLTLAVYNHSLAMLELLLRYGAQTDPTEGNTNGKDVYGMTPLMWAARGGYGDMVDLLLHNNANANAVDNDETSVLLWAMSGGHREIMSTLLRYGANPNAEPKRGRQILHWAVEEDSRELTEMLLTRYADLNKRNSLGRNALHLAVQKRNIAMIKLLLEYKADVNCSDYEGQTPADLARQTGDQVFIDLFEQNAGANNQ